MKVIEPNSAKPTMKPIAPANREDPIAKQVERQDRLGDAMLDGDEAGEGRKRGGGGTSRWRSATSRRGCCRPGW